LNTIELAQLIPKYEALELVFWGSKQLFKQIAVLRMKSQPMRNILVEKNSDDPFAYVILDRTYEENKVKGKNMRWRLSIGNLPNQPKIASFLAGVFMLLLWTFGVSPIQAAYPQSNQEIDTVETLVQVGEYRLNFKVIKGGNLIILLEAGGGMHSSEWSRLAPELAQRTGATVVSYDRAGFGKSDLPETPHDMREEVEWLWQGLQKLGLNKDLILVGHSFGGWMIRLFASEHPEATRGMVFVDPFTNEFVDLLGVEYLDNHPMSGKLPFDTSQPEKLPKFQRALIRMVGDGLGSKIEVMRKTSVPSDIPVVVITSGRPFLPKTEEQEAWRLAHEQMTESIEGATLIVAEKSDHMIPGRQPDLIIEVVTKVMQAASRLK
jgi:pimeloyl-ACP methyl ester carboxylesterase